MPYLEVEVLVGLQGEKFVEIANLFLKLPIASMLPISSKIAK